MSDSSMSGQNPLTSAGVISCASNPQIRAIEIPRLTSSQRLAVRATMIEPVRRYPVPMPVSASTSAIISALYFASMLML